MKQEPIPRSDERPAQAFLDDSDNLGDALDVDAVCRFLRLHGKPAQLWRVGLEYEMMGFENESLRRIDERGVTDLLRGLAGRGGTPVIEGENIIGVRTPYAAVTIEPGGQIEFSGLPEVGLAAAEATLHSFLADIHECAQAQGIFFVALGFDPLRRLDEQSWIKKRRYDIMRPYLRTRGGHAWDMMTRTAALQVSVDYGDEADLGRKYVLGNRLGPIIAAMFANSPFADGRETGLKSTRYAAWLDTDPDRTGAGPGTFDDCFDMQAYASALLNMPAFFLERNGALIDTAGRPLTEVPDARAGDVSSLLSMVFTEARIREYVEMRSADSGKPSAAFALMALWKGLTYDADALQEALTIAPRLDPAGFRALQMAVARDALAARCEGVDVLRVAREIVTLASRGLGKVKPDECSYLDPLAQNVIEDGVSPADILLKESGSDVARATRASTVA